VSITAISNDQSNTTVTLYLYPAIGGHATSWPTDNPVTGSIVIWGAQLSQTDAPIAYAPTTSSALSGPYEGVEVSHEWNFETKSKKIEARHRAHDGGEYVYKFGDITQFNFGLSFVNSSTRYLINDWWGNNDKLQFKRGDMSVSSVYIINKGKPIDRMVKPYTSLFSGKLELGVY
jgi:hypothetical protein